MTHTSTQKNPKVVRVRYTKSRASSWYWPQGFSLCVGFGYRWDLHLMDEHLLSTAFGFSKEKMTLRICITKTFFHFPNVFSFKSIPKNRKRKKSPKKFWIFCSSGFMPTLLILISHPNIQKMGGNKMQDIERKLLTRLNDIEGYISCYLQGTNIKCKQNIRRNLKQNLPNIRWYIFVIFWHYLIN